MKERVSDIQCIYNNTMAIKQIKYREKLRQIQETDIMASLHQFRKLTQSDLAIFQEGAKQIFRVIAPGFETRFAEITLTSTSKVFIELYQHFGFNQKSDILYQQLLHNSKQQIFLYLIQHLIDLTKIAMKCAVKRFLDMKLFCVGKEIEKAPILLARRLDFQESAVKKIKMRRVNRSESNSLYQQRQDLKLVIESVNKSKISINDIVHYDKSEIIKKSDETTDSKDIQTTTNRYLNKEITQYRHPSVQKYTEPPSQRIVFPSIQKTSQYAILKLLRQRNQQISQTISSYLKELQEKGFIEE